MSVEELAAVLHRVADSVGQARQMVSHGAESLAGTRDIWGSVFAGSSGECADLAPASEQCRTDLIRLHELLVLVDATLRHYLDQLGASTPSAGPAVSPVSTQAVPHAEQAKSPRPVESPHGDRYPGQASWGAHLMDRYSPPGSGVPVRALVRASGKDTVHEFKPGQQYWAHRATERATSIGAPPAFWRANITHHVEIEAATWMVEARHREAEIIVNRTPCGYRKELEPQRKAGCHQFLHGFLPQGYTLHVYGTDEHGRRYFIATYEGKNPR